MQQPQNPPPQPQPQPSTEPRYDSIAKVKSLVWSVREGLAEVMRVSAKTIAHNAAVDNGMKTSEDSPPRVDKALEDVYSLCNQVELHLKTIQECAVLQHDSQQYLPIPVSATKPDTGPDSTQDNILSYSQYLSTIKNQINLAKTIQEILTEGARKITQPD